jgi:hypothetical protein
MDEAAPDTAQPAPQRPGPAVLPGPLDFRPGPRLEGTADVTDDAVALGLASAKVYTFLSIDYPGAAHSEIWDFNGGAGDAVGMFVFDPGTGGATPGGADATPGGADTTVGGADASTGGASGGTSPKLPPSGSTAFTFTLTGDYQILTVPNSTASIATGINASGLIIGVYLELDGVRRGFIKNGDSFREVVIGAGIPAQPFGVNDAGLIAGSFVDGSGVEHGFRDGGSFQNIDFPGAHGTIPTGINADGDVVGSWLDATGNFHGFLRHNDADLNSIDFPLATETRAVGINDAGEIAGSYRDAAGNIHGFIYAGGQFSTVDVAGARATQLTRITNEGSVTGFYIDALNERHGLFGH